MVNVFPQGTATWCDLIMNSPATNSDIKEDLKRLLPLGVDESNRQTIDLIATILSNQKLTKNMVGSGLVY